MTTKSKMIQVPLVGRELVAEQTMTFRFEKPADWTYDAGQSVDLTLISPSETDEEGDTRPFTLSSAPSEELLSITTRLRDTAFKREIQRMPLGTRLKIDGPFGNLGLHRAKRPAVFLTGGIGITPFRSILAETVRGVGLPYRVVLFYANRRPEDAAFLDEIAELADRDRNLTFVPTMTALEGSDLRWDGERGHIDPALLARHLEGVTGGIYYLTGPAGMVRALRTMILGVGVDQDDIRTEEFPGY